MNVGLNLYLHGAITTCFLIAGLFFFRYWRETSDRLFLFFALSFWVQAGTRVSLTLTEQPEEHGYLYLFRLAAFLLIIVAIVMKNVETDGKS